MEIESKEEVIARRKEIEQEITEMLKETESDFTLDHVRDTIYNEEDRDDIMKVVAMFDRGGDISELNNILELVNDAWNYFPHKELSGISPMEKILEYNKNQKGNKIERKVVRKDHNNKYFDDLDNLNEEKLIEILNQGQLSQEEMSMLVMAMQAKGMKGSIMAIDDPNSEEGKAAQEYINYHQKLPKTYPHISEKEIESAKKNLLDKKVIIEDKKKALILLAHTGRLDAWETLEKYEKNPDPQLKIWLNMAMEECQMFLKSDLLDKPMININKVSKIGRNDLCSCGSGKKYKKCCLTDDSQHLPLPSNN